MPLISRFIEDEPQAVETLCFGEVNIAFYNQLKKCGLCALIYEIIFHYHIYL